MKFDRRNIPDSRTALHQWSTGSSHHSSFGALLANDWLVFLIVATSSLELFDGWSKD